MADTPLSQIVKQEVEEMTALVDTYLKEMWESIWPSIVELKPPAERRDWYQQIDWQALRETSEHAWALLSADALKLTRKDDERINSAMEIYRKQAVLERSATRAEMQPFGTMPVATQAQLGTRLPLGKATGGG